VSDWHSGWAARSRRIVAGPGARDLPHAPTVAGALLGLAAVAEAIARGTGSGLSIASLLTVSVLALFTTVPLAFLGPIAAATCVSLASILSLTVFHTLTVAGGCAQLIVLYCLGVAETPRRMLAPVLAAPFVVLALTRMVLAGQVLAGQVLAGQVLAGGWPAGAEEGILTVLLAALAPAAALGGIARRASIAEKAHRAARQVIADTLFDHMARGERARIARELHDVVAHHISVIAVQAETARLATPGMPAAGAQRLLEIGDTARAGLTEMRRLLGVLREDAQAASPGELAADRHPQPGLQQLNQLIDEARDAAGTGLRLIVSGPPAALDPGVELAAYRIVQEGLTNARRHAPGAAVDVELHFTDAALRLRIRDSGPGPAGSPAALTAAASGHGLPGMRERAAAAGGELRAGAARGGGFLIEATLPARTETTA
jgi:signal transduction histidine kinase